MKSSCLPTPSKQPLIIIHQWQLDFCGGDAATAALLSYFQYWHDVKLDMQAKAGRANDVAEMHGDDRTQDEGLYQFHTEDELVAGIMGIGKVDKVRKARKWLVGIGVLSEHQNPNPRYRFDRTVHYLFHPDVVLRWMESNPDISGIGGYHSGSDDRNIGDRGQANQSRSPASPSRSPKNPSPRQENRSAIPETTTEITPETSSETDKPAGRRAQVEDVFGHWKLIMNHPRANLDDKRVKLITTALKWGYTVEQMKTAIDGCAKTPHNMGINDRNEVYDGLHIILRSADQIDRFVRNAEKTEIRSEASMKTEAALQGWGEEDPWGARQGRH